MPSAKLLTSIVAEGKAVADDLKDGRLDDKGGLVRFLKSLAACCGKADAVEPAVAAATKAVQEAVKVVGDVIEDLSGVATSLGVEADVVKKMGEAVAAVEKLAEETAQAVEAVDAIVGSQSATPHSGESSPEFESPDTPPQNKTVEEPSPEPSVPAPLESRPPSESETEAASNPTHPSEANTSPDSPQNRKELESLDAAAADRARMEEVD